MTAARRLAAIRAVDVVGYSRMMGEDEAGTAEAGTAKAVREHREDPITLNANYGLPQPQPPSRSSMTGFTSSPAVRCRKMRHSPTAGRTGQIDRNPAIRPEFALAILRLYGLY